MAFIQNGKPETELGLNDVIMKEALVGLLLVYDEKSGLEALPLVFSWEGIVPTLDCVYPPEKTRVVGMLPLPAGSF